MLLMTWEYVAGNIGALMCTSQAESVRERLRQDFLELLPLDESRSVESRVYLAFSARAAVSAPLAEVQHSLLESLRIPIAKRFQEAKDGGEASPDLHPSTAAAMTVALIDGLLVHMLTDPSGVSREMAAAVLDAHLDCCFTA
jgi:AcrR family transcriptional regulator